MIGSKGEWPNDGKVNGGRGHSSFCMVGAAWARPRVPVTDRAAELPDGADNSLSRVTPIDAYGSRVSIDNISRAGDRGVGMSKRQFSR